MSGLFLLPILIILIAGCTDQQPTPPGTPTPAVGQGMEFFASDNAKTVSMPQGTVFRVSLEGNPTTGYTWNATLSDGLELLDSDFATYEHTEGMVGVGGTFSWDVVAKETGTQTFSAIYMRPWEDITGEEDTFSMTFIVE